MRRVISYLIAICCYLTLTGCGHNTAHDPTTDRATDSAAEPTPTSATSNTPSRVPTPAPTAAQTATTPLLTGAAVKPGEHPPTISAYVNQDNASGALAFAAYFYKALDWSIATTNPNLLRPISAPSCATCQTYIDEMDTVEAAGGYSMGDRLLVTKLSIAQGDLVTADFVVQVTFNQQAQVLVSSAGAPPVRYKAPHNPGINYLYMNWRNGWHALEIGLP